MPSPTKLIFLPGAGGNPQFWQPVADLLQYPAPRKLLGWPGFGSVPPDPRVQGLSDLVTLVENNMDQPCALIAQSMGGVVALQAALRRPELITHLVLTVTSGGVAMAGLNVADWRPDFYAANPDAPRWLGDYAGDLSTQLSAIRIPVLLLWGDADPISPVAFGQRLHGLLPKSRLQVIAGGGHDLAYRFADLIASMIEEHLGRGV